LLVTHRRPDGRYERFTAQATPDRIALDTARADLMLGQSFVQQRNGTYYLWARGEGDAGRLLLDLAVRPLPRQYFPPVELRADDFLSGYVVPGLAAEASGKVCVGGRCSRMERVSAYHDHNWGVWRDVTWEWGAARGGKTSLLYGGVYAPDSSTTGAPFFLTLVDSLGVRQVLRFRRINYQGLRPAEGERGVSAPERFSLTAARDADTLRLDVQVEHALASRIRAAGLRRYFLQMRGRFTLRGRMAGEAFADSGQGFFETYVAGATAPPGSPRPAR
jgi:hypothetical protein